MRQWDIGTVGKWSKAARCGLSAGGRCCFWHHLRPFISLQLDGEQKPSSFGRRWRRQATDDSGFSKKIRGPPGACHVSYRCNAIFRTYPHRFAEPLPEEGACRYALRLCVSVLHDEEQEILCRQFPVTMTCCNVMPDRKLFNKKETHQHSWWFFLCGPKGLS